MAFQEPGGDLSPDGGATDRSGPWEQRIQRASPWLAWSLALLPLAWALLRLSGAGAGTRLEILLVFTPFAALASPFCIAGAVLLGGRRAAAVATLASAGLVLAVAPLFTTGPNANAAQHGHRLRVMTFNAKYGEADADEVLALVEDHQVDVLGIQELTPDLAEALDEKGLQEILAHRVLAPSPGASGMGLYANTAFEEVDLGVVDEIAPITGRFRFARGAEVEITVVHPLPPLGRWRGSWLDALGQLAEVDVGGEADPVRLIIGDFNATLDQPTMRALLDAGYHDAASAAGRGWVPTWGPGAIALLAIDHVLVDSSVHVEMVEIHSVDGSDHRAVIGTVQLPRPSG